MSDSTLAAIIAASAGRKPWPPEILEALHAPFADDELTEGSDGLTSPTYPAIVRRLDEVFDGCWSAPVTHQEVLGNTTPFAIVRRSLVIHHPDLMPRCVENFGGRRVTRDSSGKFTRLDKDFKSAATMALRKDCLDIGIGLYLTAGKGPDAESDAADPTGGGNSTPNQHEYIRDLTAQKGLAPMDLEAIAAAYATREAASARIEELKALPNAPKQKAAAAATPAPAVVEEKAPESSKATKKAERPKAEPETAAEEAPVVEPAVPAGDRDALMVEVREFIAGVVKAKDIQDKKVSDLLVSIFNKQKLGKAIASPEDATAADLKKLLDYFNTPDEG